MTDAKDGSWKPIRLLFLLLYSTISKTRPNLGELKAIGPLSQA